MVTEKKPTDTKTPAESKDASKDVDPKNAKPVVEDEDLVNTHKYFCSILKQSL
jgi:hypothetical protein